MQSSIREQFNVHEQPRKINYVLCVEYNCQYRMCNYFDYKIFVVKVCNKSLYYSLVLILLYNKTH